MVGTAAEILTIGSVDRYIVGDGAMGPITARLERLFHDVVRGKNPAYAHWLTPAMFPDKD
jgi:branched-chain amino acid aminotransferase